MQFHVIVIVVTRNSEVYISDFLDSLQKQTFKDFHIILVDNGSKDQTLELVQNCRDVTIIKNSSNVGLCRARNKGIELAMKFWQGEDLREQFIFICNPDTVLAGDCLEKILLEICKEADIASAGPKLLRILDKETDNLAEMVKTEIIDSLGLELLKSRKIIERFSGMADKELRKTEEVFGINGALCCYRAAALEAAKWEKEYFDEDFFAYQEDIDIGWRFRNIGWKNVIIPDAIAYRRRYMSGDCKAALIQKIKNQKNKPRLEKSLSLRNHLWLIAKNDFGINFLADFPFIILSELGKFFYYLFLDTKIVQAYFSALAGLPKILLKRNYFKNTRVLPREIRELVK